MIEKIEIDYHDEIQLFFKGDRLYGIIGDFPHFPELIEIDQENGEIVKRIQLEKKFHGGFRSATSDGENFWLSSRGSNHELVKVSQKGEILEVIRTTFQNMTFAWSDNYLWIYGGEKIYKFDVNEGKVLDEIDFPNRISSMDSLGNDLIIKTYDVKTSTPKLIFLDASSKEIYDEFYLSVTHLQDFAAKDGVVFTIHFSDLYKFDLTNNSLIDQIEVFIKSSFGKNFYFFLFYVIPFCWLFSFYGVLIVLANRQKEKMSKKEMQEIIEGEEKVKIFLELPKKFETTENLRQELQTYFNRKIPDLTKVTLEEFREFREMEKNR
ncbi:MAG: hypothetical protein ACE5HW_00810 [Candidatus Methanofastidiosia archaeon]